MHGPDLTVDGHAPEAELNAAIAAACRQLLPGWADLERVDISVLPGGISNALFKVSGGPGQAAAFRVYGDHTERFTDRERELGIMRHAHRHGFGPQVLANFSNGRIEEFLPMRPLKPEELAAPEFAPTIAATLRRFHDIPPQEGTEKKGRMPFGRIYEWLDIAEHLVFEDPQKQEVFATFDSEVLRAEVRAVEAAAALANSPLVFSHNDLVSGNIMVPLSAPHAANSMAAATSSSSGSIGANGSSACDAAHHQQRSLMTFIDFEYVDWAPRGFDWGIHFCEYAGFQCDYSRYPQHQAAATFIRHYLAGSGSSSDSAAAEDAAYVSQCVAEANIYALAAHQYSGTWSLLQANWSSVDFGYLGFAKHRWGEYFRRKDEFLAGAAAAFT